MALFFKPHMVRVYLPEEVIAANKEVEVGGFSEDPAEVPCRMQSTSPVAAFEQTGIETKNPYMLYCELADKATFRENARVQWPLSGQTFRVKTAQSRQAFADTSHCIVLLESENFTI